MKTQLLTYNKFINEEKIKVVKKFKATHREGQPEIIIDNNYNSYFKSPKGYWVDMSNHKHLSDDDFDFKNV